MASWKEWVKEHRSNLFFFLLGSSGGGTLLGTVGHAIANDMHGHPTDWALFAALMIVAVVLLGVGLFLLKGTPKATAHAAVWTAPDYALNGYRSEEEQRAALAEKARLTALGQQLDGVFNGLQIEAFRLSRSLQNCLDDFIRQQGTEPQRKAFPQSDTAEGLQKALIDFHSRRDPWEAKLRSEYVLRFEKSVTEIYHRFVGVGLIDRHLGALANNTHNRKDFLELITTLRQDALKVEELNQ